jgi:hypothetical protein
MRKRGGVREKKRGDRNATVPGRRTRRQIEVVKSADAESAARLGRHPGRLDKLEAGRVTKMLVDDAIAGDVRAAKLLMKMTGLFGGVEEDEGPRRFKQIGRRVYGRRSDLRVGAVTGMWID